MMDNCAEMNNSARENPHHGVNALESSTPRLQAPKDMANGFQNVNLKELLGKNDMVVVVSFDEEKYNSEQVRRDFGEFDEIVDGCMTMCQDDTHLAAIFHYAQPENAGWSMSHQDQEMDQFHLSKPKNFNKSRGVLKGPNFKRTNLENMKRAAATDDRDPE